MPECEVCSRKSQTYLCHPCQQSLKDLLIGLAAGQPLSNGRRSRPWLQNLDDVIHGDTRLGESARRSTEHSTPLPVNLGASQLHDDIHDMLMQWVAAVNVNTETLAVDDQ